MAYGIFKKAEIKICLIGENFAYIRHNAFWTTW